jgi:hypothetical protein
LGHKIVAAPLALAVGKTEPDILQSVAAVVTGSKEYSMTVVDIVPGNYSMVRRTGD